MKMLAIYISLLFFISCDDVTKKAEDHSVPATITRTPDSLTVDQSAAYKWVYSDEEDKMTSQTIYYASIDADNQLDLKFPYNGRVTASKMIRKRNSETAAILELSKGQFMTGTEETEIQIRFDSAKAETYYCSESADADNRVLFIRSVTSFIRKLKKAKKMIIQAVLFDNGQQQMEFDVNGLKLDY